MITNFESITYELTEDEYKMIDPLIRGFKTHSKKNPIKANDIIIAINQYFERENMSLKLTGARLRKLTNHIRTNALLPLIATSKGYYVSSNRNDLKKQIDSLEERSNSIARAALGLRRILNKL